MRTWIVGIIIGACILISACEKIPKGTVPGTGENTSAVEVVPRKTQGLLKPWDFTYDCVTNDKLGLGELNRCREELAEARSDK
jgi:hypothetical protein